MLSTVAITLWCLATHANIVLVFGVAYSTVCEIVQETCQAIVSNLMHLYIQFPTSDAVKAVVEEFEVKWGFPQCIRAIDQSHIPIAAPEPNHTDYYNRKGWYSMLVQAVVDHEYPFRDMCWQRT